VAGGLSSTMTTVRVLKPKKTILTVVERQATAGFLWDRYLNDVMGMAAKHKWDTLWKIVTNRRLADLEEHERMRRVALLMFGQGVKVRPTGKVYPSDARLYLDRAAERFDTDPEGLRALVSDGLVKRGAGEEDDGVTRLFRAIGLIGSSPNGFHGRYSPESHDPRRAWPHNGEIEQEVIQILDGRPRPLQRPLEA
jgi:hypothetical protein